jgi:hypothetical protein
LADAAAKISGRGRPPPRPKPRSSQATRPSSRNQNCNEVLSHIPTRSSPVGACTGAPRNEGYLPPAGERGNERHRLGRSHLCDSSGFRSLASIAGCRVPGLGSPSSVSLHGRISFGSPLESQEPQHRPLGCLAIADSRRARQHHRGSPSRVPRGRDRATDCEAVVAVRLPPGDRRRQLERLGDRSRADLPRGHLGEHKVIALKRPATDSSRMAFKSHWVSSRCGPLEILLVSYEASAIRYPRGTARAAKGRRCCGDGRPL